MVNFVSHFSYNWVLDLMRNLASTIKFLFNVSPYRHELEHWTERKLVWRELDTEIMQVALWREEINQH